MNEPSPPTTISFSARYHKFRRRLRKRLKLLINPEQQLIEEMESSKPMFDFIDRVVEVEEDLLDAFPQLNSARVSSDPSDCLTLPNGDGIIVDVRLKRIPRRTLRP